MGREADPTGVGRNGGERYKKTGDGAGCQTRLITDTHNLSLSFRCSLCTKNKSMSVLPPRSGSVPKSSQSGKQPLHLVFAGFVGQQNPWKFGEHFMCNIIVLYQLRKTLLEGASCNVSQFAG